MYLPLWAVVVIILGVLAGALILLGIAVYIYRFYKKFANFSRREDAFGMIVFEDESTLSGKKRAPPSVEISTVKLEETTNGMPRRDRQSQSRSSKQAAQQ